MNEMNRQPVDGGLEVVERVRASVPAPANRISRASRSPGSTRYATSVPCVQPTWRGGGNSGWASLALRSASTESGTLIVNGRIAASVAGAG